MFIKFFRVFIIILIGVVLVKHIINDGVRYRGIDWKLSSLDKQSIKKNDYNAQTCIPIRSDGTEYIPLIIKDEATKNAKKERGEIEDWDKRTMYLDLSPLYRKIKNDAEGK